MRHDSGRVVDDIVTIENSEPDSDPEESIVRHVLAERLKDSCEGATER